MAEKSYGATNYANNPLEYSTDLKGKILIMNSRIIRTLLFIGILAVGTLSTVYMMANRIEPDRTPAEEHITPVTVVELKHVTEQVMISGHGTVMPAQEVKIQPEVTGRITEMSSKLIPGSYLPEGTVMARIDSRDYQAQYETWKNQVAQATLGLKQEQARQVVAKREWHLLGESIPKERSNQELALRIPQIESAEAALAAAGSGLSKAELDIERCTIRAPFNALVLRENIDPGQLVTPQTEITALAGTDRFWIKVSVPLEYLPWIVIPEEGRKGAGAKIIQTAGSGNIIREGYVIRLLGDLDPDGRLARLLVAVEDPLNLGKNRSKLPLLIGSYVSVQITGKPMSDIVSIPRSAVRELEGTNMSDGRNTDGIWIMDKEGRLRIEPVHVVWRMSDAVFIDTRLQDGAKLITSNIPTPIRGMKLTVYTD